MPASSTPNEYKKQSAKLTIGHRLHFNWEYRKFFGKSEVFRFSECIVFRIPNEQKHFRLGITLKARGSSIERNAVKRQIREIFRKHAEILGDFDYNVVIPASKKLQHPFAQRLAATLGKELKNVGKST